MQQLQYVSCQNQSKLNAELMELLNKLQLFSASPSAISNDFLYFPKRLEIPLPWTAKRVQQLDIWVLVMFYDSLTLKIPDLKDLFSPSIKWNKVKLYDCNWFKIRC